jgi:hypothetical protein
VTRAADKSTTLQWFRLSALRRHGWGEQRICDTLEKAAPEHWRGYPQLAIDWVKVTTEINCEADTAAIHMVDRGILSTERIEELALLLPADINGAPLSPEDARAALALPVDVSNAPAPAPDRPLEPKEWFDQAQSDHPRRAGERTSDYAKRLHGEMLKASHRLRRVWELGTVERALRGR